MRSYSFKSDKWFRNQSQSNVGKLRDKKLTPARKFGHTLRTLPRAEILRNCQEVRKIKFQEIKSFELLRKNLGRGEGGVGEGDFQIPPPTRIRLNNKKRYKCVIFKITYGKKPQNEAASFKFWKMKINLLFCLLSFVLVLYFRFAFKFSF